MMSTIIEEELKTAPDNDKSTEDNFVAEEQCVEEEVKESKADKKKSKKLETQVEELQKQLEEAAIAASAANDKYLRMIAEYDNFRKRSVKERELCYADAHADAVTAMLPILDNLERAVSYTDAEAVAQGVTMILKSFNETFEKLGVKEIESLGKTFDPNFHNAVMHIDDEQYGENEIVEVLQKGYVKGDKVIRYAMVKVAN